MSYSPTMMRFAQADPMGYVDGMNPYQALLDNPVRDQDPSGLYSWDVNTTSHTITLKMGMSFNWLGNWTPARKSDFMNKSKKLIEDTFNSNPFTLTPKSQTYSPFLSFKTLACPGSFKPQVEVSLSGGDWNVFVQANPTGKYIRSWTFGFMGGLDEADVIWGSNGAAQYPVVHEFGHWLGLMHPGILKGKEYGHVGNDLMGRPVNGTQDLMGEGMALRDFYFNKWKNHLNWTYPGADYEIK